MFYTSPFDLEIISMDMFNLIKASVLVLWMGTAVKAFP